MSADRDTEYLERLNEAQRAAVEYCDGPELVIAGAGSGKTRVLTYKIVHLLRNGHHPRHLMALTFTNKAAREMRDRISTLVGDETASKLWMGTFHSIFARILRVHAERLGFSSNFTIYDAADSKSLIKSIIRELKLDDKIYRPGTVAADISTAKNNLLSPEDYAADPDIRRHNADCRRSEMPAIYRIYRDRCRVAGAMDFDDLLYYTNILLRDNPDILERYRNYFSYILVDEYQDTNFAQHLIVRMLAGQNQHLCVVGDDAQSIYSFRGANIRNILDLKRSFPALRTFKLEENYRSTKNIIGAANTLIAANKVQIPKEVYSNKEEGERIEVVQCYNDYEEAYIVANRLSQIRMRTHLPLSDFAILYRTNAQSRVLEEALRNRNVAYRVYGGLAFYQRKEIKDAVCYFRLAVNPNDEEAFRRVVNTPKRGIGDTTLRKVAAMAMEKGVSMYAIALNPYEYGLDVNRGTAAKLTTFAGQIADFAERNRNGETADALAKYIMSTTGLIREYASDRTPESVSKHENLLELLRGVDQFAAQARETDPESTASMGEYLAEISLLTDQDSDDGADTERITLMTIHAAKGLEFSGVFIVGVEEDLLPSALSQDSASEIEEERRLMYVAITRAKRFCMISYARQRGVNGKTVQTHPSRFIRDIDRRYLRLMTGTTIEDSTPRYRRTTVFEDDFNPPKAAPVSTSTAPVTPPRVSAPKPASPKPAPATPGGHTTHTIAELAPGQRIEHSMFGHGIIREVDGSRADDRIVVEFSADGSRRTLLLKFARFNILS